MLRVSASPLWENLCQIYFLFTYDPCITSELEGRAGCLFKVMAVGSLWVWGEGEAGWLPPAFAARLETPHCVEILSGHTGISAGFVVHQGPGLRGAPFTLSIALFGHGLQLPW